MLTTKYVRCRVSLGLFGTELYVVVGDSSAFVDGSNVKVAKAPEQGKEVEGIVFSLRRKRRA